MKNWTITVYFRTKDTQEFVILGSEEAIQYYASKLLDDHEGIYRVTYGTTVTYEVRK